MRDPAADSLPPKATLLTRQSSRLQLAGPEAAFAPLAVLEL